MILKLFYCIISLNVCVYGYPEGITSVNTPVGQIRGVTGQFTKFLGIPYGLVDEKNPFGDAIPHPHFKIPREAFDDSAICPQYTFGKIKGTIECLHLNIYKPNVISQEPLPVMVYIHGGAFAIGNGAFRTYSPRFLMRHNVIFVTINYRLGPYGHLCLPNTEYNNQALKDQNLAIRWVKNNIGSFGGDPDNILLYGHSSGAASVHFHLLMNKDILFNKVILQSGVAVASYINEVTDTATFVKDVGLNAENIDVDHFIQTISSMDADTIINITKLYNFRPCIDGQLIMKTPKTRNLQNIKLMIGETSDEGLYFYPRENRHDSFDFVAELNNGFSVSKMADSTDAIDVMKHFYLDNLKVNIDDFLSDLVLNYPTERTVRYYIKNHCTVYRYLFSYEGARNYRKIRENVTLAGCIHGDELGYLYEMPAIKNTTQADQVIIDRMTLLWTNFAKYGDPTPSTSNLLPVKWTPATADAQHYLQIDTNLELHNGPFQKRMAFWDSYYAKYGAFAKGINLGEKYTENRAFSIELSKLLLLLSILLVWQ